MIQTALLGANRKLSAGPQTTETWTEYQNFKRLKKIEELLNKLLEEEDE